MGDLVFTTPLLAALRQRFPQARISWLVRQELAPLMAQDPRVDEVIAWAPPRGLAWLGALRRLRAELAPRDFDWVIEAQGLLKTRLLARQAGGYRIGFASREPGAALLDELLPKGGDISLIGSEYRFLAEQLCGQSAPPALLPGEAARTAVTARQQELGLGKGYSVICPFTTRPQKHWPQHYWPPLIKGLIARRNQPVLMLGGPADRAAATDIANAVADERLINLVGATGVAETPAWVEGAGLVVGVDTGLTHMGVALARPTVALFGSTCPYTGGGRGPLTVMYDDLPCAPCQRRPTCGGRFTCMRDLGPERVLAAAMALLA